MPKPINPTIGSCPCVMKGCEQIADVRKMKNGRLYLVCPAHGVIRPNGDPFQDYILENARMHGGAEVLEVHEPEPEPTPEPTPAPEPDQPEPAPEKPKRKGWADDWF